MADLAEYRRAERTGYNDQDIDALLSVFDEDIQVGSVGHPVLSGHDELRAFFDEYWSEFAVTEIVKVVDEDVAELNGYLVVWSRFTIKLAREPDDTPAFERGRTLAVFRKHKDGRYKMWREAGLDGQP